jgi:hypothetical protein
MTNKIIYLIAIIFSACYFLNAQEVVTGGILDKNVNGNDEDYNAYLIYGAQEDTLFFTSSRDVKNRRAIALPAEIFYSTRPSSDRLQNKPINEGWSAAKQIVTNASRIAQFTRGSQAISNDRIIFAAERDLSTSNASGSSYLFDLWEMIKSGDGYSLPEPLTNLNDPDAWDSQPALSPDGKVLVFTSNRAGGAGHLDLWYSVRDAMGVWSPAKLVPDINTPEDEISPHFGADGKFYFSSNWDYKNKKKGDVGKEVFRAEYRNNGGINLPVNPVNLDEAMKDDAQKFGVKIPGNIKYNSDNDDEFGFITPDYSSIFITSNRKADFGKRNIYAYSLPKSKIRLLVNVKEQVLDSKGNLLIPPMLKSGLAMNLTEKSTGKTQSLSSGIEQEVEANKSYDITFNTFVENECFQNKIEYGNNLNVTITKPFGLDTLIVREFLISKQKVDIKPIIFNSTDTLPYFITGYWYPNTSENLKEFRNREADGFFNSTGFVDSTGHDYESAAQKIDREFDRQVYSELNRLLPSFQEFCRDTLYLKVTIHGYTDPRGLSGGEDHPYRKASQYKHNYPDETITVGVDSRGQPVTINSGIDMWKQGWPINPSEPNGKWIKLEDEGQNGNILLSKLRAHFMFVTFDRAMSKMSPIYKQMRSEGRVIVDAEGYGIDKSGFETRKLKDDPTSRRIEIYLDVLRPEEISSHKRLPGGASEEFYKPVFEQPSHQEPEPEKPKSVQQTKQTPEINPQKSEKQPEITKDQATDPAYKPEQKKTTKPVAPLEPVRDIENKEPYKPVESSCYTIQFITYNDKTEAEKAISTFKANGLNDAKLSEYFDPFGNAAYRLRYGCYSSSSDATAAFKELNWMAQKLNITKKPVVIKE